MRLSIHILTLLLTVPLSSFGASQQRQIPIAVEAQSTSTTLENGAPLLLDHDFKRLQDIASQPSP
jgi:hypothetical protein